MRFVTALSVAILAFCEMATSYSLRGLGTRRHLGKRSGCGPENRVCEVSIVEVARVTYVNGKRLKDDLHGIALRNGNI